MRLFEKIKFFLGGHRNRLIAMTILFGMLLLTAVWLNTNYFAKDLHGKIKNNIAGSQKKQLDYSNKVLRRIGEDMIKERAKYVKLVIEDYLENHKGKSIGELRKDKRFRNIALREIGKTGYTAIHGADGINYLHIDPKVEMTNLKNLNKELPEFWKIIEAGAEGRESSGYYQWINPDGEIVEKYMYIVPLERKDHGEQKYLIASTIEIKEFTGYIKQVEGMQMLQYKEIENLIKNNVFVYCQRNIVFISICFICLVIFSFIIGNHFGSAVYLASHDQLTGLYNRRAFMEYAEIMLSSAKRREKLLAIIMIDLERFKEVNDKYGHNEGDKVLKTSAGRFKQALRKSDLAARVGGDEFAIIAEISHAEDAKTISKKLKESVRSISISAENGKHLFVIGASVGWAIYDHFSDQNIDDLLRTADMEMYNDKNASR